MRETKRPQVDVDDILLLKVPQAARSLGISARTLWDLTHPRGPIPCVRIGSRVLYARTALEAWVAEQVGVEQ